MAKFKRRSKDSVKLPLKPIRQGFKSWVLASDAYFYSWIFHLKQSGPVCALSKAYKGNSTQGVVVYLTNSLPKNPQFPYTIWLNNLFTSLKLLKYLRSINIGAAGTARLNSGISSKLLSIKS